MSDQGTSAQTVYHLIVGGGFIATCGLSAAALIKRPILRAILTWPITGLGVALVVIGAILSIWNSAALVWYLVALGSQFAEFVVRWVAELFH
jgi:hypothetical protein